MSDNQTLYDEALEAITELFNDSSVTVEECAENLRGLIDEIETMIESLGVE